MLRPEPTDIILILLVALFIFGPKRIPEIARALGGSIREFRDGLTGKVERTDEKPASNDSEKS